MTVRVGKVDAAKYGLYMRFVGVYQRWLRWKITGLEHIPAVGSALIVGNHAGLRLHEGWALAHASWSRKDSPRSLRGLMHLGIPEDSWVYKAQTEYMGAVPGTPEHCLELFRQGEIVGTYPEGARSTAKPFSERDQLLPKEKWGRGWARLAVQTDTPVIPVGAAGVETAIPTLFISRTLGRRFRLHDDLYPVSPQTLLTLGHPFLNPLLPFPVRCALTIARPIVPSEVSVSGGEAAEDALFDAVYTSIEQAVAHARLQNRKNK
ncbi:MAG: 1-acyl-sn-glycerol-3-phosphate acyltransferase [Nocardiaceae bacterium]|nr:1-acyl-sn-glycerol-3-phosphate acyltransferase [Nocardiaceae bacterium]